MVDELVGVSGCFEHMLSQYLEAHSTLVEGLDRLERRVVRGVGLMVVSLVSVRPIWSPSEARWAGERDRW